MGVLIFCTTLSQTFLISRIIQWDIKRVKWSRYRPGVAQRVGRGMTLLFHDRGTRRGWVVSSTPRPHFTPGKDHVPILQEPVWAPEWVWTGGKFRPHQDSIPDRPAYSQALNRLSYPEWDIINAHKSSCKVAVILVRFEWKVNFLNRCSKMLTFTLVVQ